MGLFPLVQLFVAASKKAGPLLNVTSSTMSHHIIVVDVLFAGNILTLKL